MAVEVELQRKASARLSAILSLYERWLVEDRITGVIYVCADEAGADQGSRRAGRATSRRAPNRAARKRA